jgi:hypothetical protein
VGEDWYYLPDGSQINIPSDASREDLTALFDDLSEEFPDSIGTAWSSYGDKEDEGSILGALAQGVENIPRGIASVPLLAAQGIAGVLTPHKDTAAEQRIRDAQEWLYSGIDPKYRESHIANIGMGLGQLVPIVAAARALAPLGAFAPMALMRYGAPMVNSLSPAARNALLTSSQQMASGSLVSVPMMMGDAATRIADYEERTGEDIPALKELAAFGLAAPVGVLETLPIVGIGKIPGFASQTATKASMMQGAGLAVPETAKAFLTGATTEAVQEATSELLQTTSARALYDDKAYEDLGERVMDAGIVGGGAGGIAAVLLNLAFRRKGGAAFGVDVQAAGEIERDIARRGGRQEVASDTDLEISQEDTPIGFGLANPNLTEEEYGEQYNKRFQLHLDQLERQEQLLAEETPDYVARTPGELGSEAKIRVDEDIARDTERYNKYQSDRGEVELESGLPFLDLDNIGGMPIEEIVTMVQDGRITLDTFEKLLQADRISKSGGDSRNELKDFAERNALPNNTFDAGAVATAILASDPVVIKGKRNSEDLLGPGTTEEQMQKAIEMLTPILSPETMSLLLGTQSNSFMTARGSVYQVNPDNTTTRERAVGEGSQVPTDVDPSQVVRESQPASKRTFYVKPEDVRRLGLLQTKGEGSYIIAEFPGLPGFMGIKGASGDALGKWIPGATRPDGLDYGAWLAQNRLQDNPRNKKLYLQESLVSFEDSPQVGLSPVESWVGDKVYGQKLAARARRLRSTGDYGNTAHFGNVITEMIGGTEGQRNLNPDQVNQIVEEARASINQGRKGNQFRVKEAYNMIFGFRGGVDMYDRVQRTYSDKGVQWTENQQGGLELTFADDQEVEVVDMIRGMTADQIWNSKTGFKKAVLKFLKKKNITLPDRATMGDGGQLDSDAFKAIVKSVTGKDSLQDVTQSGQRKAIMGRLVQLPTYKKATPLIDLSRKLYTPEELQTVVIALNAKPGQTVTQLGETVISERGVQNAESLDQIMRHLQQGGYVVETTRGKRFSLAEDNRTHARTPQDVMVDRYRQELEEKEKAEQTRNQTLSRKIDQVKTTLSSVMVQSGLDKSGAELQLGADVDPIYAALVNDETGIIKNPQFMEESAAALDGPNARIFVNLSRIDPDGTRPIPEIIQDFRKEIWRSYEAYQYLFESELKSVDGRVREDSVPKQLWEEYSADPHAEMNFLEFAAKIDPDGTKGEVMADARAMYMEALSKGLISKKKSAGQVGSLKKRLINLLKGSITASRDTGMQDVMSIYGAVVSGDIGRRGPGRSILDPDGPVRNLRIQDYVNPKHFDALKQAIADEDTDAQRQILDQIAEEDQVNRQLADVPERSWQETLENRLLAQREYEATNPGEVPSLGKNASDNALEAYFDIRRGDRPYRMPDPIKHKFRRKVKFVPTQELSDLVNKYGDPETQIENDERLTGEVLIEAKMSQLQEEHFGTDQEGNEIRWQDLSPRQQFLETRKVYDEYAWNWKLPWQAMLSNKGRKSLERYLRTRIADSAYPIELSEQMLARARDNIRRLADQSAVGAVRNRDNTMGYLHSVEMLGGIVWMGDMFNGYHEFVTYGDDQMTLDQMYGLLETAQDRLHGGHLGAAMKFLDQVRFQAKAQMYYDKAVADAESRNLTKEQKKQDANLKFFPKQLKPRPYYDKKLSPEEMLAKAEEMVQRIREEAPHVAEFIDQFQKHNQRTTLPWLLSQELITPEMYEYLYDMAYVPLFKNIGMVAAYPMGSDGTGRRAKQSKRIQFGQMTESDGYIFDHALDSFADIDKVDIIESIQYSQLAMIRDGLSNVGARRVVDMALKLEELGFGKQAYRADGPGPDTLRIMVNGNEEYWRMADPELASATMLLGFNASEGWMSAMFEAGKISSRMLRWGIINFPVFIHRNFVKDGDSLYINMGGQEGVSMLPVLRQIRKATEAGLLQRGREVGLVSGGGGAFWDVSDLISGIGPAGAALAELGKKMGFDTRPGARRARESRQRERYLEVLRSLEDGTVEFKGIKDYAAFVSMAYRNLRDLGELTARMSAYDLTLGRTGNIAQARLDGHEVMNYGRRGSSPTLNAVMAMVPFMSGGITGLDNFLRSHTGAPDALGAHLVDPAMTDEAAQRFRNQTFMRGMHLLGATLIYYMMIRDDESYDRLGEVEKMNNFIIPVGDKYFKMPISFTTGMFYKAIPESVLRALDEEDYTFADDVTDEVIDQIGRNLDFHVMPQILRPLYNAARNHNDFTNEPIVPYFMEDLPPEMQRTDYTSNMATGLAKIFGVIPGAHPLSSPQKMEYLIRQYMGYAGLYSMMVGDRITREVTGQNIVGTRYDWGPSSLLNGQGIENFPVLGDIIGDWREGNASTEKFYELQDEVNAYVAVVNKLQKHNTPEELQEYLRENQNLTRYRSKVRAYGQYMKRWRERRDIVLMSDRFTDEQKQQILYDMIEEKDRALEGITDANLEAGERPLSGIDAISAALKGVR